MIGMSDTVSTPDGDAKATPQLSVIVPVYNEAENVTPLCDELHGVLEAAGVDFELIFADDGSSDGTAESLAGLQQRHPRVRVVTLRRRLGQTAALSAGIDAARGAVLVPMDGDLQNDPGDIPRLLAKLDQGHDVVSGWRRARKDPWLNRRLPSRIANWLISRLTGVRLHDYGCTLKAYRRDVLEDVRLYGEMHRFVPIYAAWQGARVAELEVNHRPRTRGRSKYGIGRTVRVVLDLLLLVFLDRYAQRPMHLFGGIGLLNYAAAAASFLVALYFKLVKLGYFTSWGLDPTRHGKDFVESPLPLLVVLFFLTGTLSVLMGLLAEMVMRTYYESQGKKTYRVR
jgi:glycosyltransferase involved in cell wall biosynthesis